MKKNYIALFMAVSMTTLFAAGCGSSGSEKYSVSSSSEASAYGESFYEVGTAVMDYTSGENSAEDSGSSTSLSDITGQSDQKMVITYDLALETENYDETLMQLRVDVSSVGGYIEYESEYTYSDDDRSNSLTIRIPEAQAESWVSACEEYGVIRSRRQSAENVTLQYTDMESRLTALRTEQTTLLGIMEKAESVEDIIAVQTELQNVNYEIEYYESAMRALENSVNYSTVNMTIDEVRRETPNTSSFGQEIKEAFTQSIENLKNFGRGLVLFFAGNLIMIVIISAIVCVLVLAVRKFRSRKAKKQMKKMQSHQEMPETGTEESAETETR